MIGLYVMTMMKMTLVDNNRMIREDLKPLKTFVKEMEQKGLIVTDDYYEEREYMDIFGEQKPVPFVYIYRVTKKGDAFYEQNQ
jgi:hypothetical protein